MTKHQHPDHHHDPKAVLAGAPRSLALLLCLGALAGVLIWAKLRLVTDIPRSAYADPRDRQVVDDQAGDTPDRHQEQDPASAGETGDAAPDSGETPESSSPRP